MFRYGVRPYSYKARIRRLTREEEEIVRRHVEEAKRRAYEQLRERDAR